MKPNNITHTIKKISIGKAEEEDVLFWLSKSHEERLNALQELREQYIMLFNKQAEYNESRKRLRRVLRIIKQA